MFWNGLWFSPILFFLFVHGVHRFTFFYKVHQGVIQKLRGQDEVGRWSVQCPRGQKFKKWHKKKSGPKGRNC